MITIIGAEGAEGHRVRTDRRRWVARRDIARDHHEEVSEEEGVVEVEGEVVMDTGHGHFLGRGVGRRAEVLRDRRTVVRCRGRRRRDEDMEDAILRRGEADGDEEAAVVEVEVEEAQAIVLTEAGVHETVVGVEIVDDRRDEEEPAVNFSEIPIRTPLHGRPILCTSFFPI